MISYSSIRKKYLTYNEIFRQNIILWAPYPPPVGGISIHIHRLLPLLKLQSVSCHLFNHGSFRSSDITPTNKKYIWPIIFLLQCLVFRRLILNRKTLFHFHVMSYLSYLFAYVFALMITQRLFLTIHNQDMFTYSSTRKHILTFILKRIKLINIISVSKSVAEYINSIRPSLALYLPAFIMPEHIEKKPLPFKHQKGHTLIAACMWRLNEPQIYRYGMDMLLRFIDENKTFILYVFVGDIDNKCEKEIKNKYIKTSQERVVFLYGESFISYIHNFALFVRPNREDGFGVSVAEALSCNVGVVASDVCERMTGTVLFKNGDSGDLTRNIHSCLAAQQRRSTEMPDYTCQLLTLYKQQYS
jgi:glycosyltransferase involved in cell wall biosynthesis